jgi:hypothetical protein
MASIKEAFTGIGTAMADGIKAGFEKAVAWIEEKIAKLKALNPFASKEEAASGKPKAGEPVAPALPLPLELPKVAPLVTPLAVPPPLPVPKPLPAPMPNLGGPMMDGQEFAPIQTGAGPLADVSAAAAKIDAAGGEAAQSIQGSGTAIGGAMTDAGALIQTSGSQAAGSVTSAGDMLAQALLLAAQAISAAASSISAAGANAGSGGRSLSASNVMSRSRAALGET